MPQQLITVRKENEAFWIRMSILEVSVQAQYAHMAYINIAEKPNTGNEWATFSSIHSFLSHCTLISKLLKAPGASRSIADILNIPGSSVINKRAFRNGLEHYDERLKKWVNQTGVGTTIVNHHIGDRQTFPIQKGLFVSFYDPYTKIFTLVNKDFDLKALYEESQSIKQTADDWLARQEWESISSTD